MFGFFFKILLGKTLPLPLVWSFAYPGLNGDVYLKDLRVGRPEIASVQKVEIQPRWSTLLSSELWLERIEFRQAHAEMSLDEPLGLIQCVSSGDCSKVSRCSSSPQSIESRNAAKNAAGEMKPQKKDPISIYLQTVLIQGGKLVFCRGGVNEEIEISEIAMKDLRIPSQGSPFSLQGSAKLLTDGGGNVYPFELSLRWLPADRRMEMTAQVHNFPLSAISKMFPELIQRDAQKGIVIPLQFGNQKVVQEIRKEGNLNGEVLFQYFPDKPVDKRWEVKLP